LCGIGALEQEKEEHPTIPGPAECTNARPQRWRDAVSELLELQAEYADWSTALPDSLRDSATAEALEVIAGLDLNDLADIEPPRGYGRD